MDDFLFQRCIVPTIVLYSMVIESDGSSRLVRNDQWMLEYRTMVSILVIVLIFELDPFCFPSRLRSESRSQANHDKYHQPQPAKKLFEPVKIHQSKGIPSETKVTPVVHISKEAPISSLRAATAHTEVRSI